MVYFCSVRIPSFVNYLFMLFVYFLIGIYAVILISKALIFSPSLSFQKVVISAGAL